MTAEQFIQKIIDICDNADSCDTCPINTTVQGVCCIREIDWQKIESIVEEMKGEHK